MAYIDKATIKKLMEHDEDAFNTFYDNYHKLLFFIIVNIVKNQEDAYDVLQNTYIKILQNISTLKDINAFHQWVGLVAKNQALDFLRKNQKYAHVEEDQLLATLADEPTEFVEFDFDSYLSPLEKTIATYKIVYEYSFQEISTLLNMSTTKIFYVFKEAKKKIKEHYTKECVR